MIDKRVLYATAVYDQDEIDAILGVLDGGRGTLRLGKNVAEMERQVATHFGKARGVMCNSGSSALYLAIELLGLPPGSEVITSPLTFSTDLAPLIRADLTPVFVDRAGHIQRRRRRDRGHDRGRDSGDPDSEPRRQRSRLGPDSRDRRSARLAGRGGLM